MVSSERSRPLGLQNRPCAICPSRGQSAPAAPPPGDERALRSLRPPPRQRARGADAHSRAQATPRPRRPTQANVTAAEIARVSAGRPRGSATVFAARRNGRSLAVIDGDGIREGRVAGSRCTERCLPRDSVPASRLLDALEFTSRPLIILCSCFRSSSRNLVRRRRICNIEPSVTQMTGLCVRSSSAHDFANILARTKTDAFRTSVDQEVIGAVPSRKTLNRRHFGRQLFVQSSWSF